MPQNRETGRAANTFGFQTARRIAEILGAIPISSRGNEFLYNGQVVAIKCARRKTTSIGVTYAMLNRLEGVIGAFQIDEHNYDLYRLSPHDFCDNMKESKSRGNSKGLNGLVSRLIFREIGHSLGRVYLE